MVASIGKALESGFRDRLDTIPASGGSSSAKKSKENEPNVLISSRKVVTNLCIVRTRMPETIAVSYLYFRVR